ncbi:hypothetical protein NW762_013483 [Fusarium torreyae]|uniref:NAD(P)-binding domain-containing protein n=1 Tax=Fusarium torreyae TaxID=1237075 RepID=A0A9W8V7N4_9HYPO|nr:hypothetical protein NW762_013483 [Fusarium torreyae]
MQITIAPASMRTSTAAIRSLISQDKSIKIKALYRDLKKVPHEFNSLDNFTAVQGDVCDVSTLDFSGSDAVLACLPPAYDGRDIIVHAQTVSDNIRDATEKAGSVKRLVLLSSVGAEFAEGVGELKTNHISEEVLKATNIPEITIARCAYFMENWTMSVETLKGPDPFFFSTITPLDFRIAMVAAKDIGQSLATELIREWTPPTKPYIYELHGPQPYSPLDVQQAFSQALNKHVEVRAVEKDELPKFYGQIFAPQIVDEWVEMTLSFLPGGIAEKDPDKPSGVDVINGKTTLGEAIEAATAQLK